MAFFDVFSSKNTQSQQSNSNNQNNQSGNQGNQSQGQQNQPQGNGGSGGQSNMPQGQQGQQNNGNQGSGSPNAQNQPSGNNLDLYSKLWDNPSTEANTPPTFSIDPKIMDQVAGSQDFTKGLNPELLQKATSGDINALMEVIQGVGRNAYRASIEHGGMLTDKFVGAREAHSEKGFTSKVRKELTGQALANTPNYQHPVVRKQLSEIADRFQQQHPDATPGQIAEMAKKYLNDLVAAMNPESQADASKKDKSNEPRGQEFWDKFFDEEPEQT